jgi:hypothetical protein
MALETDRDRVDNPVLGLLAAIIIGQSWVWLIAVAGIFVATIVLGTTLARLIGAALLLLLAGFVWRAVRST